MLAVFTTCCTTLTQQHKYIVVHDNITGLCIHPHYKFQIPSVDPHLGIDLCLTHYKVVYGFRRCNQSSHDTTSCY